MAKKYNFKGTHHFMDGSVYNSFDEIPYEKKEWILDINTDYFYKKIIEFIKTFPAIEREEVRDLCVQAIKNGALS